MIGFKRFLSPYNFAISRLIDTAISAKTSYTHAPENSDSAGNRSKIREEKILAYTKVREFSPTRNFTISRPLDEFSCGRSMVEMLGVLAIIGVLTVGGIAGFQKAMIQYKLNKWSSDVNQLISNLQIAYSSQGKFDVLDNHPGIGDTFINITNLAKELNAFPENMLHGNNLDIFNNKVRVEIHSWEIFSSRLAIWFIGDGTINSVESCKRAFDIAQSYPSLWAVRVEGGVNVCGKSAPKDYQLATGCGYTNSLSDIAQSCKTLCTDKSCTVLMLFSNQI